MSARLDHLASARAAIALMLALFALTAPAAHAATATFEILLDLDRSAATGCTVATAKGPVAGIEQVLVTTVTTTASGASVTGVSRRACAGGSFGAPVAVSAGGWAVGFGIGTGGTAVIETFIPQIALGGAGGARVTVSATGGGGSDAIVAGAGGGAPEITFAARAQDPAAIPALGPAALALLSLLLALAALHAVQRSRALPAMLLAAALATSAGLALAAAVVLDGQIGDWSGVPPLATDAKGNAPRDADVVALFAQSDAANVYFRIDADLALDTTANVAPAVSAGADQTITLPAAASLAGTASDDGQPSPPGALTIAWSKVSGPGTVTFANASAAATTATFGAAGTYVLRLTASDGTLSQSDDLIVTVNTSSSGGLLSGSPGANAMASLPNAKGARVASADIVHHRILTQLYVVLKPDTTVGQFNAAAAAVGATAIGSSRSGSRFLSLVVPRQPGIGALNTLARTLRAQPGIEFADAEFEFVASVLPNSEVPGGGTQYDHLQGTRLPLAWNAQGRISDCLPRQLPVIVFDKFGSPTLRPDFTSQFLARNFVPDPDGTADLDAVDPEAGHGYDVSHVMAAKFDTTAPIGAQPFDDCIEIHQVDEGVLGSAESLTRLAERARQLAEPRFIIQVSGGTFPDPLCGANSDLACTDATLAATTVDGRGVTLLGRLQRALQWAELAAAPGRKFSDRMLVTVSAGNKEPASPGYLVAASYPGFHDANWASPFALAALLDSVSSQAADAALWTSANPAHPSFALTPAQATALQTNISGFLAPLGTGLQDILFQTLTVGSVTTNAARAAATLSAFSYDNALLLAPGEGIVIYLGDTVFGTSFSAPQVAGIAATLWAHSDSLRSASPADTAQILRSTSTPLAGGGGATRPHRQVDAYQALLNLDVPGSGLPVRKALLDLNDDGVFDDSDLVIFQTQYGLFPGVERDGGSIPDFGRYDLNGDGYTAGPRRDRFDLDVTGNTLLGAPQFGTAVQTIEGQEVRFDETAVRDLDALCFYAYSSLYTGTPEFRREVLGLPRCLAFKLEASFPGSIPGGATTTLVAHATQFESNSGVMVDASNVYVSVTVVEGATVTPAFGITALDGTIGFAVKAKTGATTIRLIVEARRQEGDSVLGSVVVTASVGAVPSGVIVSPNPAALGFGRSRVFTALTGTPPFAWGATGGSITQAGVYTAGNIAGEYYVLASSANGGSGLARVVVDALAGIYRGVWGRFGNLYPDRQVSIGRFLGPLSGCVLTDIPCYQMGALDFGGFLGVVGPCDFQPVPGQPGMYRGPCDQPFDTYLEATASETSFVGTIKTNLFNNLLWTFDMTRQ